MVSSELKFRVIPNKDLYDSIPELPLQIKEEHVNAAKEFFAGHNDLYGIQLTRTVRGLMHITGLWES